jgi:hypothetical protein
MEIHLLHCTRGGERMASHDVVQDNFVSVIRDVNRPIFFATYFFVDMSTGQHCGFSGWRLDVG